MNDQRFDRLSRTLAEATSRRGVLKVLVGTALGGLGAWRSRGRATADDNNQGGQQGQNQGEHEDNFGFCIPVVLPCQPSSCCVNNRCVPSGGPCTGSLTCCKGDCVNTQTDPAHCGSSCVACDPTTPHCSVGKCVCFASSECGADKCCVNGVCTSQCPNGGCCIKGVCIALGSPCGAGLTCCGGACVNTQTDPTHCGPNCAPCPNGQTCVNGSCQSGTCGPGTFACGPGCCRSADQYCEPTGSGGTGIFCCPPAGNCAPGTTCRQPCCC